MALTRGTALPAGGFRCRLPRRLPWHLPGRRTARTGLGALAFTLAVAAATLGAAPRAEAQKELTRAEHAALARGELVTRPREREYGDLKLVGGVSWQVVDLPPDAVWRAVTDYSNYKRFIPVAIESRITHGDHKSSIVRIRHARGPVDASYSIRITPNHQTRTAEFKVDKTKHHDIREGWGYFGVAPYGTNKTVVTFGIFADVGEGIIAALVRPKAQEWMLRVPAELRKFVLGSGRKLYAR